MEGFLNVHLGDGRCQSVTAKEIRKLWVFVRGVFRGFFPQHLRRGRDARERRGSAAPARYPGASAASPSFPTGGAPRCSVKILSSARRSGRDGLKITFPKEVEEEGREGPCIFTLYQFPGPIHYTNKSFRMSERKPEEQKLLSQELSRNFPARQFHFTLPTLSCYLVFTKTEVFNCEKN